MTAAIFGRGVSPLVTTDGVQRGCDVRALRDLTSELTTALDGAIWSYMLQAELEDAFDTALFRAVIAETPTLSGPGLFAGA
jgi:hypothetical protein